MIRSRKTFRRYMLVCSVALAAAMAHFCGFCSSPGTNKPTPPTSPTLRESYQSIELSEREIQAHKPIHTVPQSERDVALGNILRVLNAKAVGPCSTSDLTPLRGWVFPARGWTVDKLPRGNFFLLRKQAPPYTIQVIEGRGLMQVDIRTISGERIAPESSALTPFAISFARHWLSSNMQPKRGPFAASGNGPHVATWQTNDVTDSQGFQLLFVNAYTDGTYLTYRIDGAWPQLPDDHPTDLYTFGDPKPAVTYVKSPEPTRPDPGSDGGSLLHKSLTQEERRNERN